MDADTLRRVGPVKADSRVSGSPPGLALTSPTRRRIIIRLTQGLWLDLAHEATTGGTSRAIAHRKAAISRAIAVVVTVFSLPADVNRR